LPEDKRVIDELPRTLDTVREYAGKGICERGIDLDAVKEGNHTGLRNVIISRLRQESTLLVRQLRRCLG